ncbi:MAG: ATP-binding protein [Sulfurifustis sp.]
MNAASIYDLGNRRKRSSGDTDSQRTGGAKPLVLVVDDDDANRYSVTRVLRAADYDVIEANRGFDGLHLAQTRKPGLVVLDVGLPDVMGWHVCRELKHDPATSTIPILQVSSTYITDQDRARGLDEGADSYLVHPIDPDVLLATVRALLRLRTAHEALRRTDERLHTVLNSAPLIVLAVDRHGAYTHIAGSGLRQLNVEPRTFVGQSLYAMHADDERFLTNATRALAGHAFVDDVCWFERWFQIQYNPLREHAGHVDGFVAVATDITERKKAQDTREELLAIVAHDLRAPIAAMKFDIELLRRQLGGSVETGTSNEDVLNRMDRSAGRAERLIGDLLDHARIESGTFTVQLTQEDLHRLLLESIEVTTPIARQKNVELVLDMPAPISITCDGPRLTQALYNLLDNAVRFSPAKGKITVRATAQPTETVIAVIDHGAGIPEAHLPHLFNRFWQGGTQRKSGAGLGLSIAAGIVRAHGGRIWAESNVGAGATFYIALPAK